MTTTTKITALVVAVLLICSSFASVAISAIDASRADNSVALLQSLIVQGKTVGAKNSATTAQEVKTLLSLQTYDHKSTINGQKQIQNVITQVESHIDSHLDSTIQGIVSKYYTTSSSSASASK
jgi:uncharacterized membrane protein YcjF (UPF0283 family)